MRDWLGVRSLQTRHGIWVIWYKSISLKSLALRPQKHDLRPAPCDQRDWGATRALTCRRSGNVTAIGVEYAGRRRMTPKWGIDVFNAPPRVHPLRWLTGTWVDIHQASYVCLQTFAFLWPWTLMFIPKWHIPSGIAHPTLQPWLFRFLQSLAKFKSAARISISCWQKADAVSSRIQSH